MQLFAQDYAHYVALKQVRKEQQKYKAEQWAKMPPKIKTYLKESEKQRREAIKNCQNEIKKYGKMLKSARKGKIISHHLKGVHYNPSNGHFEFTSKKVKQAEIKSTVKKLNKLKSRLQELLRNNPPYLGKFIAKFPKNRLEVGLIGRIQSDARGKRGLYILMTTRCWSSCRTPIL